MKTDKAIKYNTFIKNGLDSFWNLFNQTFDQTNSKKDREAEKNSINSVTNNQTQKRLPHKETAFFRMVD